MERTDPDRLYWDQRGRIGCGNHTPYVGSDTWEFDFWVEMTPADLREAAVEFGESVTCEVCHKRDSRETS